MTEPTRAERRRAMLGRDRRNLSVWEIVLIIFFVALLVIAPAWVYFIHPNPDIAICGRHTAPDGSGQGNYVPVAGQPGKCQCRGGLIEGPTIKQNQLGHDFIEKVDNYKCYTPEEMCDLSLGVTNATATYSKENGLECSLHVPIEGK